MYVCINKCVYIHTHTHTHTHTNTHTVDHYSAIKKNEALPCEAIWIQNRNRLTDIENKHSYQRGKQRRKGQITSLGLTDTH